MTLNLLEFHRLDCNIREEPHSRKDARQMFLEWNYKILTEGLIKIEDI